MNYPVWVLVIIAAASFCLWVWGDYKEQRQRYRELSEGWRALRECERRRSA